MRTNYVVFSLIQKVCDVESSFAPTQAMLVDTDEDDDEDLDEWDFDDFQKWYV